MNSIESGPVAGDQAHGARFAGGIDFTAGEIEALQILARGADGHDLAVGSWIVHVGNRIGALADNPAVFDHHCGEWAALPGLNVFNREIDGPGHECVCHRSLRRINPRWWRTKPQRCVKR